MTQRIVRLLCALCAIALVDSARAAEPSISPLRSWTELVTSNGFTGVVVSLEDAQVHHFREHIFATEEPRWREDGEELWLEVFADCWKPQEVPSRDLLRDAYFGVAARGSSLWLNSRDVDLDASGYDAPTGVDGDGGTGIIRMVQPLPELELVATTRVFAPWSTEWGNWVMALEVENTGDTATGPVTLYGLVNANVGFGRPGPRSETGAESETIRIEGIDAVVEQGFAGTVVVRALDGVETITHSPATFYDAVNESAGDLPTPAETPHSGDLLASGYQWSIVNIPAGESAWVGLVIGHDPNPDFDEGRLDAMETWIDDRGAEAIWSAERADWAAFVDRLIVPDGLSEDEAALYRHSAAVLRMAQVRESSYWVRPESDDGVPRRTGVDGDNVAVPSPGQVREHQGRGAVLASLPPGEWAYAWVRDGAYAIVGLTDAGLYDEARLALDFYLNAHANRYVDFEELDDVPLGDYALSLTRYHGFGIEESDTTCNGDLNFEWDGFGLYLWALRHYVERTGDTSIVSDNWELLRDRVGDVIVGLVDDTGLLAADSSIWEVHWFGDEKHFAYTSIAGARGLCDLGWMARQIDEDETAEGFETAGRQIRAAIVDQLTDPSGAIAANIEELAQGTGYWDAAVIEAVGFGLFDPTGPTASATFEAIRNNLTVASGCGVFRNDDEFDAHGLSDYGGWYDSLEWIFLDYRMSIAARHAGDDEYADGLQDWVRDQSLLNFLLIAENYDAATGTYENNAPMIGFGSGSYITAMRQRAGDFDIDPACGFYWEDDPDYGPDAAGEDVGVEPEPDAGDAGDADEDVAPDTGEDAADAGEPAEEVGVDADDDAGSDTDQDVATDPEVDAEVDAEADADAAPDALVDTGDTINTDDSQTGGRDTDRDRAERETNDGGSGCGCSSAPGHGNTWLASLVLLALTTTRRMNGERGALPHTPLGN